MIPQEVQQAPSVLPVRAGEIEAAQAAAAPFRRREALLLLRSLSPRRRLSFFEAARLVKTTDPVVWETAACVARAVREEVFGRRVVLFAPLYLSNECNNNCLYCGFRRDNRQAARITLSPAQAAAEARFLERKGYTRLLLVAGEHLRKTQPAYLAEVIATIYRETGMRILHLNAAPMAEGDLRILKEAGAGVYQVFQETYHPEAYARFHPAGPKSDYVFRLTCMDRAARAGFEDVGIGALLGLYDWRFDVLAVIRHAEHHHKTFGAWPHTISVPRFRKAQGAPIDRAPAPVSDEAFARIVVLYRLAVPAAGIVVSTREPAALRERVLSLGASQISAGSKTDPGGYAAGVRRRESEQFTVDDVRPIEEIVRVILLRGFVPSLCTACYRRGRTGAVFAGMAEGGDIRPFCVANALLTLAEYAMETEDPVLRAECLAAVREGRREIEGSPIAAEFDRKAARILAGERDLFF